MSISQYEQHLRAEMRGGVQSGRMKYFVDPSKKNRPLAGNRCFWNAMMQGLQLSTNDEVDQYIIAGLRLFHQRRRVARTRTSRIEQELRIRLGANASIPTGSLQQMYLDSEDFQHHQNGGSLEMLLITYGSDDDDLIITHCSRKGGWQSTWPPTESRHDATREIFLLHHTLSDVHAHWDLIAVNGTTHVMHQSPNNPTYERIVTAATAAIECGVGWAADINTITEEQAETEGIQMQSAAAATRRVIAAASNSSASASAQPAAAAAQS